MKEAQVRELRDRFRAQMGLVTVADLRALGIGASERRRRVRSGEWEQLGRHVVRLAASVRSPEQELLAACLAAGRLAAASHQSASWLWRLSPPPSRHAVTVPAESHPRLTGMPGVELHRLADFLPAAVVHQKGIPCTDPLRTLVDLAGVSERAVLDAAVDRAIASQLVTAKGLEAEIDRLARRGRTGVGRLRSSLAERGIAGVPHPSVLEAMTLRLLASFGIRPLAVDHRLGPDGRYRVDFLLAAGVAMEVDGYAYHFSPEQKTEDERRRNRIRLGGVFLLVYTWRDVIHDARRVGREVERALSMHGHCRGA